MFKSILNERSIYWLSRDSESVAADALHHPDVDGRDRHARISSHHSWDEGSSHFNLICFLACHFTLHVTLTCTCVHLLQWLVLTNLPTYRVNLFRTVCQKNGRRDSSTKMSLSSRPDSLTRHKLPFTHLLLTTVRTTAVIHSWLVVNKSMYSV